MAAIFMTHMLRLTTLKMSLSAMIFAITYMAKRLRRRAPGSIWFHVGRIPMEFPVAEFLSMLKAIVKAIVKSVMAKSAESPVKIMI